MPSSGRYVSTKWFTGTAAVQEVAAPSGADWTGGILHCKNNDAANAENVKVLFEDNEGVPVQAELYDEDLAPDGNPGATKRFLIPTIKDGFRLLVNASADVKFLLEYILDDGS